MISKALFYLDLLWCFTKFTWREQANYFWNTWASLMSTLCWTVAQLLFVQALYGNVSSFAGYSRDELLFFLLIGQIGFYFEWTWSVNNLEGLMDDIRNGALDSLFTRPIPALFYVTFRRISLVNRLKDGLPVVTIIALAINWQNIDISMQSFIGGCLVFLLGHISWHCFHFIFAMPTFKFKQARQVYYLGSALGELKDRNLPLEAIPQNFRTAFMVFVPAIITAQLCVSVFLQRSPALTSMLFAFIMAIIFLALKKLAWTWGLKNYTSASS